MNEKQINALKTYLLEDCPDDDILILVRDINSYDGSLESLSWENMDSFDELCYGMKPWEVARAIHFGDFNPLTPTGNMMSTAILNQQIILILMNSTLMKLLKQSTIFHISIYLLKFKKS